MLSTDVSILEIGSSSYTRMREYAEGVNELHIIVLCGKKAGVEFHDGNLHVYPTNSEKKIGRLFDAYNRAAEIIETRDMHENDSLVTTQDPFEIGLIGVRLKKRFGLKLQIQVHTDFANKFFVGESLKNRIRVFLAMRNLKYADGIRVVSDRISKNIFEKFGKKIDEKKISVLPIFVDVEHIKNVEARDLKKDFPGFDFYAVMVSRLTNEKQILWAVDVVSRVRAAGKNVCLVVVGDGPLRSEIEKKDFVRVVGWVAEPAAYMKGANLFLNASLYEGYGRTLVEAVAAGVPIVTTDVGVAREVVGNEAIVPVTNSEQMSQAIRSALEKKNDVSKNRIPKQEKQEYLARMIGGWEDCFLR